MPKDDNNVLSVFRDARVNLDLTRQVAAEKLGSEYTAVKLAELYNKHDLCNHYCITDDARLI